MNFSAATQFYVISTLNKAVCVKADARNLAFMYPLGVRESRFKDGFLTTIYTRGYNVFKLSHVVWMIVMRPSGIVLNKRCSELGRKV